jgi:hypothetical protein
MRPYERIVALFLGKMAQNPAAPPGLPEKRPYAVLAKGGHHLSGKEAHGFFDIFMLDTTEIESRG